jgi:5-methylcytosine-specific restriction protein A
MRSEALFLNGVYESVLIEILAVQQACPDQVLFLQPYKSHRMVRLNPDAGGVPPTADDPMRLFISVSGKLNHVCYEAEIVGYDDKRAIATDRAAVISKLLETFQPGETGGLYNATKSKSGVSINLLHIRRLRQIVAFPVSRLIDADSGTPLSMNRTQSGGWVYVLPEPVPEIDAAA